MYFFLKTCLNFQLVREILFFFCAKFLILFLEIRLRNFGEISRNKMKISRNTKVIFDVKFGEILYREIRIHPTAHCILQLNWHFKDLYGLSLQHGEEWPFRCSYFFLFPFNLNSAV
jgi:hypothetical protein